MKQILVAAAVAAVVCGLAFWLDNQLASDGASATAEVPVDASPETRIATSRPVLSIADELIEDTWVNAARQPGSDRRTLTSATDSVCYLTRVELSGIQGPEDSSSCSIEVDDFTGFWQLVATAEEGSRSEIRCNARCFSITMEGAEP